MAENGGLTAWYAWRGPFPEGRAMTTDSRTLYATLLGLQAPWEITDVELKQPPGEVHIKVALPEGTLLACSQCGCAFRPS